MKSDKFVMTNISNKAPMHIEESKLLKRHPRGLKKPYAVESRMPNSGIPAFTKWSRLGRYETEAQRDQAIHDMRKTSDASGPFVFEYRAAT